VRRSKSGARARRSGGEHLCGARRISPAIVAQIFARSVSGLAVVSGFVCLCLFVCLFVCLIVLF
jgi:hypothetical protein